MGCKRDQSAVNVPCRSVTSGVHRVLFTMLNPSSDFPRVPLGTAEEGSKYSTFPSFLGAASKLLNTSGRPLFSRMRAVGLSLVLQCTRGRPRPHPGPATQGFWLLPGVRFPPFLELTSLTSSIILEKGVGPYSSRPPVVLDSVVRQRPGHLKLDGYHCLHSLTPFPRVGGGGGDLVK